MRSCRNILLLFALVSVSPLPAQDDYKKVGYASFYHDKFEGRKTSSGEKFRQKKMTCAHRTLPFGTAVKVTNLANEKTVIVKVNDRGPFAKGRIIDLSKAAARELDFVRAGVTKVKIEVLNDTIEEPTDTANIVAVVDSPSSSLNGYSIQVGVFSSKENVARLTERMKRELDKRVYVFTKSKNGSVRYRVMVGSFENRSDAFGYLDKIMPFYPGAFIVDMKEAD